MQYLITKHAVEQFIDRWHPEKTFNNAKEELHGLLRTSAYAGKTLVGDRIVVSCYRPEVRMVLKEHRVCVTVLPQAVKQVDLSNDERIYLDDLAEREFIQQQDEQLYLAELAQIECARQQEIKQAEGDIIHYKAEIIKINEERQSLANKKGELLGNISMLEAKLKKMQYVTDNIINE